MTRREEWNSAQFALLRLADEAYGDGMIEQYYVRPTVNHGDTMEKFIVAELNDYILDPMACVQRLDRAIEDLERVRDAIRQEGK